MNTTDNSPASIGKKMSQWGEFLEGTGKLVKGINGFVVGVVALVGTITTLILVHPDPPVSKPIPGPNQADQNKVVIHQNEDKQVIPPKPVPDPDFVSFEGTWRDDENNPLTLRQEGSTIQFNTTGNSDGLAYELIGSGVLDNQSVHFDLDCRSLGQSVGQVPADITFVNSRKAILSMTFMGLPISGILHR